jgi:hypothetical protein
LEVFVRRPPARVEPFVSGRHPKTFTGADSRRSLFYDLVGVGKQGGRYSDAAQHCGLKVEDKLELARLLTGKFSAP